MHVRAYLSFPMCAGVGIGIHLVSPLVGFPCRCGFRCAFRGGAFWRCMACNILASWRPLLTVLFVSVLFLLAFLYSPLCMCSPSFCSWGAHKSLSPRTRTLLGVLGQATLNFVAVATLLFFSFCECPKFCDLAKQRRKMFWGVSEVGNIDFALYFFWLCVFFMVFVSSAAIARRYRRCHTNQTIPNRDISTHSASKGPQDQIHNMKGCRQRR